MTLPTLHLGGTPRSRLLEGYCRAHEAVYAAIQALDDVEFNHRDYPDTDQWDAAVRERVEAREHLRQVLVYTMEHAEHASEPLA